MRDASIIAVRASRTPLRASVATLLLAAACALGGCAGNGAASGSFAMAGGDSPTIAFESIDGPPPPVFDRMVSVLDSETKLRRLARKRGRLPCAQLPLGPNRSRQSRDRVGLG